MEIIEEFLKQAVDLVIPNLWIIKCNVANNDTLIFLEFSENNKMQIILIQHAPRLSTLDACVNEIKEKTHGISMNIYTNFGAADINTLYSKAMEEEINLKSLFDLIPFNKKGTLRTPTNDAQEILNAPSFSDVGICSIFGKKVAYISQKEYPLSIGIYSFFHSINYYNNKYFKEGHNKIVFTRSITDCLEKMERLVKKFLDSNISCTYGFLMPTSGEETGHSTAILFHFDGKKWILIWDDSITLDINAYFSLGYKKIASDLNIKIDTYTNPFYRQFLSNGCQFSNILVAKEALRLKFSEDIRLIAPPLVEQFLARNGKNLYTYAVSAIRDSALKGVGLYLASPEIAKVNELGESYLIENEILSNRILKTSKRNLTLEKKLAENIYTIEGEMQSDRFPSQPQSRTFYFPGYLFNKTTQHYNRVRKEMDSGQLTDENLMNIEKNACSIYTGSNVMNHPTY